MTFQCIRENRDHKRTYYVWICCFCSNQHQVFNAKKFNSEAVHKMFYDTVTGVRIVWSMMSPWDNPEYLTRIRCAFEMLYVNEEEGVTSKVIMLERKKTKILRPEWTTLIDYATSYHIRELRIYGGEASKPENKKNILELIEGTIGNDEFNITGNMFV